MGKVETLQEVRKFISKDPAQRFEPTDICFSIKGIDALSYGQILRGFVEGLERFDQLLGFPQEQFQKETYPAVQELKEQLGTQKIPTLGQLIEGYEGKNSDTAIQNMLRVAEAVVDMYADPEFNRVPVADKSFSLGLRLVDGYSNSVGSSLGDEGIIFGFVQRALEEVLLTDYPKSLLTKQVQTRRKEMQERLGREAGLATERTEAEKTGSAFRFKKQPQYRSTRDPLSVFAKYNISEEKQQYARDMLLENNHINKWLSLYLRETATDDEQRFGVDFLFQHRRILAAFEGQVPGNRNKKDNMIGIQTAINSAEPDAAAWWSYAPHIYMRLIERGAKAERAMEYVILWGQDAKRSEKNEMHLEGAASMLTPDGIDGIVERLVTKDKYDPDKAFSE